MLRYVNLNINNDENKNILITKTLYSHLNCLNATHSRINKSLSLFIQNVRASYLSERKATLSVMKAILFVYIMAFPHFNIQCNDSTRKLQ